MDNCLCSKILSVYNDARDTGSPAFFEQDFINANTGTPGNNRSRDLKITVRILLVRSSIH
jgi:hypothetical protein